MSFIEIVGWVLLATGWFFFWFSVGYWLGGRSS